MANEISIKSSLQLINGGINDTKEVRSLADQASFARFQGTIQLTTSAAQLATGSVTDIGYFLIHNLDNAKTVSWGTDIGSQPFEIPPGAPAQARLKTGQSLYALTSSGTSEIELTALQR